MMLASVSVRAVVATRASYVVAAGPSGVHGDVAAGDDACPCTVAALY